MAEQECRTKHPGAPREDEAPPSNPNVTKKGEAIKKGLDAVLDEIDNVLEQNAEEFVESYVQRGGE